MVDIGTIKKKNLIKNLKRYGQFLLGIIILAIAFNLFLLPNEFVVGGVSGLSIVFHRLFGWNTTLFILIGSIALLIISYIFLGKEQTAASVAGSILFPIAVELTSKISTIIVIDSNQVLLSALFGGLMYGVGFGLCMKNGFTTGGTDVVKQIISKYCHISIGKAILLCEGAIILSSCFVFGLTKLMYALVILYINSSITDKVMLGISDSKAFYIITDYDKKVSEFIMEKLGHGVTVFDAKGGYEDDKRKVLFCVIPTKEYFKLKEGIHQIDRSAFFVVMDAYEVYGGE